MTTVEESPVDSEATPEGGRLHPCDKCQKLLPGDWFGCFWLCPDCVDVMAAAVGKEASERAIERVARWHQLRAETRQKLLAQQKLVYDLLGQIGRPAQCKGCSRPIFWVQHRPNRKHPAGALAPYDADGTNHFITCPDRDQFKKRA